MFEVGSQFVDCFSQAQTPHTVSNTLGPGGCWMGSLIVGLGWRRHSVGSQNGNLVVASVLLRYSVGG